MNKEQIDLLDEIIVDNFAGGGGASIGIELALGRPVDYAINHDPAAILMHKTNPRTQNTCRHPCGTSIRRNSARGGLSVWRGFRPIASTSPRPRAQRWSTGISGASPGSSSAGRERFGPE